MTLDTSLGRTVDGEVWDWDEENDLALIMVDEEIPAILAATEARVGERVVAIGSPLGFAETLTTGIISQVYSDTYQTDAAINPGNSGGPLLDMRGRVLGVKTLGFGREGLNIAFRPELLCENVLSCDSPAKFPKPIRKPSCHLLKTPQPKLRPQAAGKAEAIATTVTQIAKTATTLTTCSRDDWPTPLSFSHLIALVDRTIAVMEVGRQITGNAKVNTPIVASTIAGVFPGVCI